MSAHEHGHHHDADGPDLAPRARRDLLGLSALLGANSGLVPISDLDAGAAWGPATARGPERANGALPGVCGSCTSRCATTEIARLRAEHCETEPKP